jgi:hypothetical protein
MDSTATLEELVRKRENKQTKKGQQRKKENIREKRRNYERNE